MNEWMNWFNYKAACRTAPATQGLLNIRKLKEMHSAQLNSLEMNASSNYVDLDLFSQFFQEILQFTVKDTLG